MLPDTRLWLIVVLVGFLLGALFSFFSFSNHNTEQPVEGGIAPKISYPGAGEGSELNHTELLTNLFRNSKNKNQIDQKAKQIDAVTGMDEEKKWIVVGVVMSDEIPKAYVMDRGGPVVEVKVGDYLEEKIRIKEISSRKLIIEDKALGDKVLQLYGSLGDEI